MLDLLHDIVAHRSVSVDTAASTGLFAYIAGYLEERGMHVSSYASESYPSLVATTRGTKSPKLLLQAHLDVVPAKPEAFAMSEQAGKLFGRGVYDMKFAGACFMKLVDDLRHNLADYDFGIMFTSDEEIGGQNGVEYLLKQGYSTEICMLPDGGDEWKLETTCNGIWIFKIIAGGATAHGSRPWDGDNAISKLISCLDDIQDLFGESRPYENTMTLSQITGGEAVNQVPDSAEAVIDMRFPSQDNYFSWRRQIDPLVEQAGLKLETIVHTPGYTTDIKNPLVAEFATIAEKIRGVPMETCHSLGSTDARYFCERGIPTIVIRPIGGGHHGANEWIDKAELLVFYDVLKAYVKQVAVIDPSVSSYGPTKA